LASGVAGPACHRLARQPCDTTAPPPRRPARRLALGIHDAADAVEIAFLVFGDPDDPDLKTPTINQVAQISRTLRRLVKRRLVFDHPSERRRYGIFQTGEDAADRRPPDPKGRDRALRDRILGAAVGQLEEWYPDLEPGEAFAKWLEEECKTMN
jgi:hypothetical protein